MGQFKYTLGRKAKKINLKVRSLGQQALQAYCIKQYGQPNYWPKPLHDYIFDLPMNDSELVQMEEKMYFGKNVKDCCEAFNLDVTQTRAWRLFEQWSDHDIVSERDFIRFEEVLFNDHSPVGVYNYLIELGDIDEGGGVPQSLEKWLTE